LELAVGVRGLGQREHGIQDRPEPSRGEDTEQRAELAGRADERPVNRLVLPEELPERQRDIIAGRAAADDEAAATGERPEALAPRGGADVVDDHIGAPAAAQAPRLARDAVRVMIDCVLGAELERPLALGLAA